MSPITIVTDTHADALRYQRLLGDAVETTLVGPDALRYRLLDEQTPEVLVLDVFLEGGPAQLLDSLALSQLDLRGAVVVAVSDDPGATLRAGAAVCVPLGDERLLTFAVQRATGRRTLLAA